MASKKSGRPNGYSDELAVIICAMIAQGDSMRKIAEELGIAPSSIFKWLIEQPRFSEQYARAASNRAFSRFERIDQVLLDLREGRIDSNMARVEIDAIKWQCGKEAPKRYGERLELAGDAESPVSMSLKVEFVEKGE